MKFDKKYSEKMVFKFIHRIVKLFDLNIKPNQNMLLNSQTKFSRNSSFI